VPSSKGSSRLRRQLWTGSVTDPAIAANGTQRQYQRQVLRQGQGQRQVAARDPERTRQPDTALGHGVGHGPNRRCEESPAAASGGRASDSDSISAGARCGYGSRPRPPATRSVTDRTAGEHVAEAGNTHGGVGFQPAQGLCTFGVPAVPRVHPHAAADESPAYR
jgi:hypothetical protein